MIMGWGREVHKKRKRRRAGRRNKRRRCWRRRMLAALAALHHALSGPFLSVTTFSLPPAKQRLCQISLMVPWMAGVKDAELGTQWSKKTSVLPAATVRGALRMCPDVLSSSNYLCLRDGTYLNSCLL